MRYGLMEKADEKCFSALSRPLKYDDGIEPTELSVHSLPIWKNVVHPRFAIDFRYGAKLSKPTLHA